MNRKNDVLTRIIEGKKQLRKKQAALPFREKIRIVVRLQEIANSIYASQGRPLRRVWK